MISWLKNHSELARYIHNKESSSSSQINRVYTFLSKKYYDFLQYLIQTHAVLFLPQANVLQDIPLTLQFFLCHSAYLNVSNGNFITLNGIYGKVDKSHAKLYPFHQASISRLSQRDLSDRMISFHDLNASAVSSVKIMNDDIIIDKAYVLPVLITKSVFYFDSCCWGWRRGFNMTFREKNEFTIYNELQVALDNIRRSIPTLSKIEKDTGQKYFHWEFEGEMKKSMIEQEEDMKLFFMKLSLSESNGLFQIIDNFVNRFNELIINKPIKKRKGYINGCIKILCQKAQEIEIWKNGWNEDAFINNMNRLLINKLFKYLWPPMIALKEGQCIQQIDGDDICFCLSRTHSFIQPKHVGTEIQLNEIGMKSALTLLLKIDSVCTPLEKVMYIFSSFKILEQMIRFYQKTNVTADLLFPLCLFLTIKAQLPYFDSTIYYIEEMQMQINSELSYYYCNFMACKDFVQTLCYNSLKESISQQEYEKLIVQTISSQRWTIPKTGLVIPQKLSLQKIQQLIDQKSKSNSDDFLLQYYQNIPLQELTPEDIPKILNLLQELYNDTN
ncbi:Vacuolar sorting protein 9 (VPS9) domain containing protein, putative [Entamoeba histolytica]